MKPTASYPMAFPVGAVLLASLLAAACPPSGFAQDDAPSTASASDKPAQGRSVAAEGVSDGAAGKTLRIPLKPGSAIAFGPFGCPVLVVDGQVWSVKNGRLLQTLDIVHQVSHVAVLSDDGRWFAYSRYGRNTDNNPISIFSTETGEEVFEVPGEVNRYADFVTFSLNKYLLVGGRTSTGIQVWDFQGGKMVRLLEAAGNAGPKIERGKIAFTSDGKQYAVTAGGGLGVYQTTTGKPVVVMSPPSQMDLNGQRRVAAAEAIRPTGVRSGMDSMFVYAWLQAMKFSPDNKELAAISTHPVPRLISWDALGEVVMDERLDLPQGFAFGGQSIQWLPDNSGWLVTGRLFDRATSRIVLGFRHEPGSDSHVWVVDKERLLASFGGKSASLETVQIPWEEIRKSLQAFADNEPAYLAPGQAVSLEVQLTGPGDGQTETTRHITEAFTRRLQRDGLTVASDQKIVFRVRFSEAAGDSLPIYARQSPFNIRGRDPVRTAAERKGELVLELIAEGELQPLWRDAISASGSRSFQEDINDATIRKSVLDNLTYRIGELNIPYFIPKSPDLYALPVVVQ